MSPLRGIHDAPFHAMLARFSRFLDRHEPLMRLLMRLAMLALAAFAIWDFHLASLDIADIADRVAQMQEDISSLRDSLDNSDEDQADAPVKLLEHDSI